MKEKEAKSSTSLKDKVEEIMIRLVRVVVDSINRKVLAVPKITRTRSPTRNMEKKVDKKDRISKKVRTKVDTSIKIMEVEE